MPLIKNIHPTLAKAIKTVGGKILLVGTKPWVYFKGDAAEDKATAVVVAYSTLYGHMPIFAGTPWRADQTEFDYAVRLDP